MKSEGNHGVNTKFNQIKQHDIVVAVIVSFWNDEIDGISTEYLRQMAWDTLRLKILLIQE